MTFLELTLAAGHDPEVTPRTLLRVSDDYPLVIHTGSQGGSVLDLGHMQLVVDEDPDQIVRQLDQLDRAKRVKDLIGHQ